MFGFLYSILAYVAFLASFSALGLFADGLLLPKTVDTLEGAGTPGFGAALAINIGLLLAWGVQHSFMARERFKVWLTRFIPQHLERATYVLASSIVLTLLMIAWQPMDAVLWQVHAPGVRVALWSVNALAWVGVPVASFLIDHFDVFGLKQAFTQWRRGSYARPGFVMPWLYRYVRHPMMTALLVALWAAPTMTLSHLVLSLGFSLYIYIGVYFEERALRRELGADYVAYQARVPKFVPRLGAGVDADEVAVSVQRPSQA